MAKRVFRLNLNLNYLSNESLEEIGSILKREKLSAVSTDRKKELELLFNYTVVSSYLLHNRGKQ